jgi:hypothetical protein
MNSEGKGKDAVAKMVHLSIESDDEGKPGMMDTGGDAGGNEGKQGTTATEHTMDTGGDAGGNEGKQSMVADDPGVTPKWGGPSKWGMPVGGPPTSQPQEPAREVESIYDWVERRKNNPPLQVWGNSR